MAKQLSLAYILGQVIYAAFSNKLQMERNETYPKTKWNATYACMSLSYIYRYVYITYICICVCACCMYIYIKFVQPKLNRQSKNLLVCAYVYRSVLSHRFIGCNQWDADIDYRKLIPGACHILICPVYGATSLVRTFFVGPHCFMPFNKFSLPDPGASA